MCLNHPKTTPLPSTTPPHPNPALVRGKTVFHETGPWYQKCWGLLCYNIASVLCFGFFGQEACGILAPQPEIEPAPPALEGEVLTTGPPGKSQDLLPFKG